MQSMQDIGLLPENSRSDKPSKPPKSLVDFAQTLPNPPLAVLVKVTIWSGTSCSERKPPIPPPPRQEPSIPPIQTAGLR
ncbi:MAG: hypothetical protein A2X77_00550 [Gammaproteobacteria bacterium GWE2_42_36]|nr:MAG: hypothetical protein A2X77_00550 [Gammaproteobacteria bacterium GWE2_42_36]HCU05355.1 hypothetical protein [Coxiellaceae bacterium]